MALPLYKGVEKLRLTCSADCNAGLWYDKFFDRYRKDWTLDEKGESRKEWIKSIAVRPVGDGVMLQRAVSRLDALTRALGGEVRFFATDWRFVTGLSRYHPVENGFAWHHTLGVPFLPGSSVKGVTRAWAEAWAGADPKDIERVFGPEDERKEKCVGSVIFFDALPSRPVQLAPDVMTPHYAEYYKSGSDVPPGDWFDPLPIPFLTVAPGQEFVFALAPRRTGDEGSYADCRQALRWLEEALAHIGAGAKTAVGYGRFVRRAEPGKVPESEGVEHRPEPAVDPDIIKADQLIGEVRALRNSEVPNRIQGFYQRWRDLEVRPDQRRRVAEAILQKIKDAGREKQSRGKDWYRELLESVRESPK